MMKEMVDIENRYNQNHCVDGVSFVAYKDRVAKDRLATDDDNALFTGLYLAAACYRAVARKIERGSFLDSDLDAVFTALEGITLLTNVSGVPGVLVRQAFPLEHSWERIGYDPVKSLKSDGNTFGKRILEGRLYHGEFLGDEYAFLTKTTKDQITGVLFGLSVAFTYIEETRPIVSDIVSTLWRRMQTTDYSLMDHKNNTFGSTAHKLDEPLRFCLDTLYRATNPDSPYIPRYKNSWFFNKCVNWIMTLHYNRFIQNTYTYNLNLLIAHSLRILIGYHDQQDGVDYWIKRLYRKVENDHNPHFDILAKSEISTKGMENLSMRIENPYHKGFCWSRDPEEWFDGCDENAKIGPSIDALLPYWMNQYIDNYHKQYEEF